jgi:hypothetical protein
MIEIRHSGLNQHGVDEISNYYKFSNGKHLFKIGYCLSLPTTKQFKDIKHISKLGLENVIGTWDGFKVKLKHLNIEVYEVELKYSRVMW